MNVFTLRDHVITDYHRYVESFLNIRDGRIREFVAGELERGVLWPEPLVQLNPAYEMGRTVSELVADGVLHPLCEKIFQKNNHSFHLYHHQDQAIRTAARKEHYILTTGTGSGKSLTYLIPIIDHILKHDPVPEQTRALIVYPMNALINSQARWMGELLANLGEGQSPIRHARYTGQERREERQRLQEHPPHILLTNYVMLELMMSRPVERVFLDRALANLEFLVLDELHTYTGRQGADVGMLVRRVRNRCGNEKLLCIGTSATMVSGGSRREQRQAVARVAGTIFGVDVPVENVIDERLRRSIHHPGELTQNVLRDGVNKGVPEGYEDFIRSPLAAWIEDTFGIEKEREHYTRRKPITLCEGAEELARVTGIDAAACRDMIRRMLHRGGGLRHPDGTPVFAVRLHQFISQGDSVYATMEEADRRHLTLSGQRFAVKEDGKDRLLAPLVFCRVCGREYYQVIRNEAENTFEPRLPRELSDVQEESRSDGYLLIDREDDPAWSEDRFEELPDAWFRDTKSGRSLKSEFRPFVPRRVYVWPEGVYGDEPQEGTVPGWFLPVPFLTCLCCGAAYERRTRGDFRKLARLSSEGRSTATTLICLSTVHQMQEDGGLAPEARKVLSFTDNRQDAALQAGHFNDFVMVGLLRSAIYRALPDTGGLDHAAIAPEVVSALGLPQAAYARNPGDAGVQPRKNREAFTGYIEYRIYQDLRRGWRVVQPNLEQCGLLAIEYAGLNEVCGDSTLWADNPVLRKAAPETRYRVAKAFLDHLRRSLALDARCLQGPHLTQLKNRVNQTLTEPWTFDDDEWLEEGRWFAWGHRRQGDFSLAPISVIGKYLRSPRAWPDLPAILNRTEYENLVRAVVKVLGRAGYLAVEAEGGDFRIQLQADSLLWARGDGSPPEPDPVRSLWMGSAREESIQRAANPFFTRFYREAAAHLGHLEAREHTGQTFREDREDRENRFRAGSLACLFCSPTMELGIDIADLNTVNMRNVPPTPANYAQRSGRAGRSGQPAFITTYCSTGSGHDRYFFRRQPDVVAGIVVPPRLDLANEDLVHSHVHAVWLARVGLDLGDSIADLVDLTRTELPLLEGIGHQIELSENKIQQCLADCRDILLQCKENLDEAGWYSEEWLESALRSSARRFDEAFDRWRELYNTAHRQLVDAQETLRNAHQNRLSRERRQEAERLEREAQNQKDLLCNRVLHREDSDFYPYRYLASEGFLPGYNFPRLPVRAYISRRADRSEFLARPRFLALAEFGPRNVLYHEGRKYRVVRSLFPAGDPEARLTQAKLCKACGAFHTGEGLGVDVCEQCSTTLDARTSEFMPNLFGMSAVSTQRAERINCDEEERIRQGYEITTHFRFSRAEGQERKLSAEVREKSGELLLSLTYGPAADLWQINRRWRRSGTRGYTLDLSRGFWTKKQGDLGDTALDAGDENVRTGIQVFVRDSRNILLVRPAGKSPAREDELANLQHALLEGLCALFQIDQREVASERIGEGSGRAILYWEAAEGGVGVLQRLVLEPEAMSRIAERALVICHFDQETGNEINPGTECARACYDCLLTYRNQWDHSLLNRHLIKDLLMRISRGSTQRAYESRSYDGQYQWLRQQIDARSELERDFLDHLYRGGRRLPDAAQKLLPGYPCCPDFFYEDGYVCVFCDGSVHDDPLQKAEDHRVRTDLVSRGFRVVVIRYDRPLGEQVEENRDVFGVVRQ
ncbi:MAG: DEAD/DEAH box helicase [Deltaproteobacteria bacterium]|nr:DEAD/DEAH box helicase [Deltaproteobacteria bacterium]